MIMLYRGKDIQQVGAASCIHEELRTTRPMPLRVQIRQSRRWGWFGPKGWSVRVTLVSEQQVAWRWGGFVLSIQEVCELVGLTEHDPVWSIVERPAATVQREAEWTPFIMF